MLIHNPDELASYIRDQRKSKKLSQSEVGDSVGLQQNTISEFEIRPDGTKLDTLFRILSATHLELHLTPKDKLTKTDKTAWKEEW